MNRMNRLIKYLVTVIVVLLFGLSLTTGWARMKEANNAFAKDCANRGGSITFVTGSAQCMNAKSTR